MMDKWAYLQGEEKIVQVCDTVEHLLLEGERREQGDVYTQGHTFQQHTRSLFIKHTNAITGHHI